MKIAFLSTSSGWGGLEQNLLRYARWMAVSGHDVHLFVQAHSPLCDAAVSESLSMTPITRPNRYFPFRAARNLRKLLKAGHFEILWTRDPRDLELAGWACKKGDCSLIFQQGMQINRSKKMPWHRMRFGRVDHWVSPLNFLEQEALKNTPLQSHQTSVIPLALEAEWFAHGLSKESARAQMNLPKNVPLLGVFGRLDPLKGQEMVLRTLREATDWHALFIGANTQNEPGNHEAYLKSLVREWGISDRVHWRPSTPTLLDAYPALDLYVMSSRSETFGMVTIEAMACGIPIIGTRSGGTPELLGHGDYGHLIQPDDHLGLSAALERWESIPKAPADYLNRFRQAAVLKAWESLVIGCRR